MHLRWERWIVPYEPFGRTADGLRPRQRHETCRDWSRITDSSHKRLVFVAFGEQGDPSHESSALEGAALGEIAPDGASEKDSKSITPGGYRTNRPKETPVDVRACREAATAGIRYWALRTGICKSRSESSPLLEAGSGALMRIAEFQPGIHSKRTRRTPDQTCLESHHCVLSGSVFGIVVDEEDLEGGIRRLADDRPQALEGDLAGVVRDHDDRNLWLPQGCVWRGHEHEDSRIRLGWVDAIDRDRLRG